MPYSKVMLSNLRRPLVVRLAWYLPARRLAGRGWGLRIAIRQNDGTDMLERMALGDISMQQRRKIDSSLARLKLQRIPPEWSRDLQIERTIPAHHAPKETMNGDQGTMSYRRPILTIKRFLTLLPPLIQTKRRRLAQFDSSEAVLFRDSKGSAKVFSASLH
jgi:hypothetical protein